MPPPPPPQVIQVQQKVGGGVVRGTIDAAKFVISAVFLLTFGTCVYVCGSAAKHSNDAAVHYDTTTHAQTAPEIQGSPVEREPQYDADHDGTDIGTMEYAAERALYAHCSKFDAFREGSKLRGTYVEATKKRGAVVNVSVDLADRAKSDSFTLWYEVAVDRTGKPTAVTPRKEKSAELCGMTTDRPFDL